MKITLDTVLVRQMESYSKSEFEHLLRTEQSALQEVFPKRDVDSSIKSAVDFCSYFLASTDSLQQHGRLDKKREAEALHLIGGNIGGNILFAGDSIKTRTKDTRSFDNIPFNRTDTAVLDILLREYFSFLHEPGSALPLKTPRFFEQLCGYTSQILQKKYNPIVADLSISHSDRIISFREKSSTISTPANVPAQRIHSTDINRSEIIGNGEAISKLERGVRNLLLYDPKSQSHPLQRGNSLGYQQGFLLLGDTGSGKTLSAKYAMSLGESLASTYNKKFSVMKFNMFSSYQEGGVQMLQSQLQEITQGDQAHFIFVDEIDTVFASRNEQAPHYQRMKLGEFMRFLDGDYENKGNYILVATANDPEKVDRALKNARLERIYCPGPETAEERGEVLKLHLEGLGSKHDIQEFGTLGTLAQEYQLTGRQLRDVTKQAREQATLWSSDQWHALYSSNHIQDTQKLINNFSPCITEGTLIKTIEQYGRKDREELQTRGAFHTHES